MLQQSAPDTAATAACGCWPGWNTFQLEFPSAPKRAKYTLFGGLQGSIFGLGKTPSTPSLAPISAAGRHAGRHKAPKCRTARAFFLSLSSAVAKSLGALRRY